MAISPLLRNAIDCLEHALEHYLANSDRDRRFAILHTDQAVELILKERLRHEGISTFSKHGRSLGIHEALKILRAKGAPVPEAADLELLHEERNRIQHQYSTPDENTTSFYIEKAIRFMARILTDELHLDLRRILSAPAYENFETFSHVDQKALEAEQGG